MIEEFVKLCSVGIVCGVVLSVIPYIVGLTINAFFKAIKKGGK